MGAAYKRVAEQQKALYNNHQKIKLGKRGLSTHLKPFFGKKREEGCFLYVSTDELQQQENNTNKRTVLYVVRVPSFDL